MWVPSRSSELVIDARRAAIPTSLGLLTLIWFAFHPPAWVMVPLALLLPGYLALEFVLLKRRRPDFDKEFGLLLQREDAPGLWLLLQRSRVIRLMAVPGYIDEKRGLIYSLQGDWLKADRFLERAYLRTHRQRRESMLTSLLRAKYENEMLDEAEEIAEQILGKTSYPGTPDLFLGLILLKRGEDLDKAAEHLVQAAELLGGADRKRALAALTEIGQSKS